MLGKPQTTQFTLLGLVQKLRFNYYRKQSHCLLCEFMIEKNQIDDKEAIDMLKMSIALNDTECLWWRKEIVDHWRLVFTNRKGFIPTLDNV